VSFTFVAPSLQGWEEFSKLGFYIQHYDHLDPLIKDARSFFCAMDVGGTLKGEVCNNVVSPPCKAIIAFQLDPLNFMENIDKVVHICKSLELT
jgi:hypothetical protein